MIRKAQIKDIKQIHKLINRFAARDLMLGRSLNELYENIRDFWVCEENNKVIGCCALHVAWDDLAEIKSLAVEGRFQNKGIGTQLVLAAIAEVKQLGTKRLFVLTYRPDFFKNFKFKKISHNQLPHKIWVDCIRCPKFPDCKEVALLKKL
ncbi:MAG: N-acetyltransferase [Candidatus Omnitrophota bacterium]